MGREKSSHKHQLPGRSGRPPPPFGLGLKNPRQGRLVFFGFLRPFEGNISLGSSDAAIPRAHPSKVHNVLLPACPAPRFQGLWGSVLAVILAIRQVVDACLSCGNSQSAS